MDGEATKGSSPLGGTFALSYGADFTDDIDFGASNETVKAALEAPPSTRPTCAATSATASAGRRHFTKALGDLPLLQAHMQRYEVQHVRTLGGDPTPLGGSFALRFGGAATGAIPYDASAATVKQALEALPTVQ